MLEVFRGIWVNRVRMMIRMGTVAFFLVLVGVFLPPGVVARAQSATSGVKLAQADDPAAPQPRRFRRPTERLHVYPNNEPDDVYPRYYPGPDAVRVCNATYVQEFRPSGTVIVPRVSCHWTRG
jgi:hypothetical protein